MARTVPIEPMPAAGRILIDRGTETEELVAEFSSSISNNSSRIVCVEGEAGLGKSTLVKDFLESLQGRNHDVKVAYGTSTARLSSVNGYEPVRQALADLSTRSANRKRFQGGVKQFLQAVHECAPDWLPAIPIVGDVLAAGASIATTAAGKFASSSLEETVPQQFVRIINETARTGPLVLVLDDLHWADASTVELVHSLAIGVDAGPFLLILCYRPFDASHEVNTDKPHPLKERLLHIARYKKVRRIPLAGLGPSAVEDIWYSHTDELLPRRLAMRIHEICAGNPLFINEYVGLILDRFKACSTAVERISVMQNLEHSMPEVVEAVIQARLMHLDKNEARVIEVASVLGVSFDPNELVALCDGERNQTLEVLRSLCRMHNVLRPDRLPDGTAQYQFEHQTLQSVVELKLEREDPFDYQELHLRAAQLGSDSHAGRLGNLTRTAHHYWEADRRELAAEFAVEAAEAAAVLGAYTEIVELTKRYTCDASAIARFGEKITACAIEASFLTGDRWAVLRIWDDAPDRFRDHDVILYVAARAQRMANRWTEAEASLARLSTPERSPEVRAAALMLRGEIYLCGIDQRATAAIEQFLEAIRLDPRPENKYRGEGHIGLSYLALGELDLAWKWLEQAVQTSNISSSPHDIYESRHWLCKASMAEMMLDAADSLLDQMSEISQKSGIASTVPFHLRDRGRVAALRNDVGKASILYAEYLHAAELDVSPEQRDRALADIALQILELHTLNRKLQVRQFVGQLSTLCETRRLLSSAELDGLNRWKVPHRVCESNKNVTTWVSSVFSVSEEAITAAEAIFRFDIPNFWLGRQHQSTL